MNETNTLADGLGDNPPSTCNTPGERERWENTQGPIPSIPKALQRWHTLCRRYPLLWQLVSPNLNESQPPVAMSHDAFRALVGTIRDPRYAPILLELLLELLGPELVKLIALMQERKDT